MEARSKLVLRPKDTLPIKVLGDGITHWKRSGFAPSHPEFESDCRKKEPRGKKERKKYFFFGEPSVLKLFGVSALGKRRKNTLKIKVLRGSTRVSSLGVHRYLAKHAMHVAFMSKTKKLHNQRLYHLIIFISFVG